MSECLLTDSFFYFDLKGPRPQNRRGTGVGVFLSILAYIKADLCLCVGVRRGQGARRIDSSMSRAQQGRITALQRSQEHRSYLTGHIMLLLPFPSLPVAQLLWLLVFQLF